MLVVEDGVKVGEIMTGFLRFWFPEFQVENAISGEEAVNVALLRKHRVMLMDINLPGMNGIEATRKIKELDPTVVIVIVTIHGSNRYQEEALDAGADAFILKDRMYAELVPTLKRLIKDHNGSSESELSNP
jgi:DNA-binding NarL/FixJ family response regulator